MARQIEIDVTNSPELLRIAEEVRASNVPRVLTHANQPIAIVIPVRERRASKSPTAADIEAFEAAAGGWRDHIDLDQFLEENYRQRSVSTRPPVRL